jgi:DNA repair ATPase RecN
VKLGFDEHTIVASKNEKGMSYTVDGKVYSKIGQNVPDEIDLVNLGELNIQEQLDQHYLITASPGEVAKEINRITKTEEVDAWISDLTSEINSMNKEYAIYDKQLTEIKEKIIDEKEFDEFSTMVDALVFKDMKRDDLIQKCEKIKEIIENYKDICYNISTIKKRLECKVLFDKVISLDKIADTLAGKLTDIDKTIVVHKEFKDFKGKVSNDCKDLITEIESLKEKYIDVNTKYNAVGVKMEMFIELNNSKKEYVKRLNENNKKLKEALKEYGLCWTCGAKLDEKHIEHILEG